MSYEEFWTEREVTVWVKISALAVRFRKRTKCWWRKHPLVFNNGVIKMLATQLAYCGMYQCEFSCVTCQRVPVRARTRLPASSPGWAWCCPE